MNDFLKQYLNISKQQDIINFVHNQQLCGYKLIQDVTATL
jgi:hypothetical protein